MERVLGRRELHEVATDQKSPEAQNSCEFSSFYAAFFGAESCLLYPRHLLEKFLLELPKVAKVGAE